MRARQGLIDIAQHHQGISCKAEACHAQILATKDEALAQRLIAERQAATEAVLAKDRALQEKLGNA